MTGLRHADAAFVVVVVAVLTALTVLTTAVMEFMNSQTDFLT